MVRIIKLVRQVFGLSFRVYYGAENVASMDPQAEAEITATLGVKPLRMDSADVVPVHRPRFCWTNVPITPVPGVLVEEEKRWFRVTMQHDYPQMEQWLTPGAWWPGGEGGAILPTCMKSVKRSAPPVAPAGYDRVDLDAKLRWRADAFRFPPYQYDERFIIWVGEKWRLVSASERELLHGLGYDHTALCWNANAIKANPQGYEDCRKTLVGDSFNCFSFMYVAALMTHKYIPDVTYDQLWKRAGLAPGFCTPLKFDAPLQRRLCYGYCNGSETVSDLHKSLLRRVNHTGSDIRISTGIALNPKCFPRQSSSSSWWFWEKVFACRWKRSDHINSRELRSIIHSVEWRIKHLKECEVRIFHLTDSYVCMSIVSKGRTSSKMLQPLLRRLSATLLAFNIYLLVSHVESTDNPTDHDSRLWWGLVVLSGVAGLGKQQRPNAVQPAVTLSFRMWECLKAPSNDITSQSAAWVASLTKYRLTMIWTSWWVNGFSKNSKMEPRFISLQIPFRDFITWNLTPGRNWWNHGGFMGSGESMKFPAEPLQSPKISFWQWLGGACKINSW